MKFYSPVVIVLLWKFLNFEKCTGLIADTNRNVSELISSKGYPVEEYSVQTADGYILSLQRIPHGREQQKKRNCKREVVFLMHGFAGDSSTFVINFPEQSLGFELADNGHDVWLGNVRGNRYSRKNVKLTPDMKEFWEFSFDEHATIDLPAMIDFILNQTREKQLSYIGYSQGTTIMFALLSKSPEFNQKIKLFIALAPVATTHHLTGVIRLAFPFANTIAFVYELFGMYSFASSSIINNFFKSGACNTVLLQPLCEAAYFTLFNYDKYQLNETRFSLYLTTLASGTSVQNALHFTQLAKAPQLQKYDYGPSGNMRHYNQATPPVYDVSKITSPVVLISGMNDNLADPTDVQELEKRLKSLTLSYRVPYKAYNHIDFYIAIDNHKLLNQKVLELLCKHSS